MDHFDTIARNMSMMQPNSYQRVRIGPHLNEKSITCCIWWEEQFFDVPPD